MRKWKCIKTCHLSMPGSSEHIDYVPANDLQNSTEFPNWVLIDPTESSHLQCMAWSLIQTPGPGAGNSSSPCRKIKMILLYGPVLDLLNLLLRAASLRWSWSFQQGLSGIHQYWGNTSEYPFIRCTSSFAEGEGNYQFAILPFSLAMSVHQNIGANFSLLEVKRDTCI